MREERRSVFWYARRPHVITQGVNLWLNVEAEDGRSVITYGSLDLDIESPMAHPAHPLEFCIQASSPKLYQNQSNTYARSMRDWGSFAADRFLG